MLRWWRWPSRSTQVLFFTHHEHLLDLVQEALRPEQLRVHRLEGRVFRLWRLFR